VTVQARSTTRNDLGEAVVAWTNAGTVWAQVRNDAGAELARIRQTYGENAVEVRVRLPLEVTKDHRLMHGDRALEIVAVLDPDNRRREARLVCREPVE
jgi:SPP1 family predicted phage head-tail adaptor